MRFSTTLSILSSLALVGVLPGCQQGESPLTPTPHETSSQDPVHPPTDIAGWTQGTAGAGALIRGSFKIVNQLPPGGGMSVVPWQLYDLAADPGDHHDLAAEHPELVDEMVAEWETNWR